MQSTHAIEVADLCHDGRIEDMTHNRVVRPRAQTLLQRLDNVSVYIYKHVVRNENQIERHTEVEETETERYKDIETEGLRQTEKTREIERTQVCAAHVAPFVP